MRNVCLLFAVMLAGQGFGQCPFPAQLANKGSGCLPKDTLIVKGSHPLSAITWMYNKIPAITTTASVVVMPLQNATTVAGGNGAGAALNQFNSPSSVFADAAGNIYIADRSNFRIMKFPPGSAGFTKGKVIAGGNGPGKALNQFQPNAVCVDGEGNFYVADDANSRVLKFPPDATGATNGIIVAGGNGAGNAANQLVNPVSVFTDDAKNLYVVDAFNDRIQKFPAASTSNTNATTVAGGNGYGDKANQFNGPAAVFVDKAGYIYVDDAANNRIQKFPPNSTSATNGVTIAGGNGFGPAANQFATPFSIWGDDNGNIYVADINNERVQMFPPGSTSFTPGKTVAGGNGQGFAANQFSGPNAVWGDNKGNLYVCDVGNNRIQKFATQPVKQYLIDTSFVALVAGTYTAIVTDTLGCSVTTNDIVVIPSLVPSVTINALPNNIIPCTQIKATYSFAATPVNGGLSPSYQWQINGMDAGTNSAFLTTEVANGDAVSCMLRSNAVCAFPATATSGKMVVSFAAKPVVSLQNKGRLCAGLDTVFINSNQSLAKIAWYYNGRLDTTLQAQVTPGETEIDTTYQPFAAGDYFAVATDASGCIDTTETVTVNATAKPQVMISANKKKLCADDAATFSATLENAGVVPVFQWLVNNISVGENTSVYTTSSLHTNDAVRCFLERDAKACFDSDTSNTIIPLIYPLPQFEAVSEVSLKLGKSIILSLPVSGNIIRYEWQPSASLSNSSVANPVATPSQTTLYTLHVLSTDSCSATDSIKVIVSSPVLIPAAFSPNGDGLNDRWYLRGGRAGDVIQSVRIFNRQGQTTFFANDVVFDDRKHGWDGMYQGKPQPTGTYVYEAIIASADNSRKIYKGTIVLIR